MKKVWLILFVLCVGACDEPELISDGSPLLDPKDLQFKDLILPIRTTRYPRNISTDESSFFVHRPIPRSCLW